MQVSFLSQLTKFDAYSLLLKAADVFQRQIATNKTLDETHL